MARISWRKGKNECQNEGTEKRSLRWAIKNGFYSSLYHRWCLSQQSQRVVVYYFHFSSLYFATIVLCQNKTETIQRVSQLNLKLFDEADLLSFAMMKEICYCFICCPRSLFVIRLHLLLDCIVTQITKNLLAIPVCSSEFSSLSVLLTKITDNFYFCLFLSIIEGIRGCISNIDNSQIF